MSSGDSRRRNPSRSAGPQQNGAVVADDTFHEEIVPLDREIKPVIPIKHSETYLANSATERSAMAIEAETKDEDRASSLNRMENIVTIHNKSLSQPPKRRTITGREVKSLSAKNLSQLENEDMDRLREAQSGLAIKFNGEKIHQFLAQCESQMELWDIKTDFVRSWVVLQNIPCELIYEWHLTPPKRGDLKAYEMLTQTLRKMGKKLNKIERGIDALYKLKHSKDRPEVIAKKIVEIVGLSNAELDKTNEDLQEFLKGCLLDTLPTATAEAFRMICDNMSFTMLVEKADELYKREPLPNPREADRVNAGSMHARNGQDTSGRNSGSSRGSKDMSKSKEQTDWGKQLKLLQNEILQLKLAIQASGASNQTANKPKKFHCWVHKIHGKRAKFCSEPAMCQWIDYRKEKNQVNEKGCHPFSDCL